MGPRPQYYALHLIKIPFNSVLERLTLSYNSSKNIYLAPRAVAQMEAQGCLGVQIDKAQRNKQPERALDDGPGRSLQVNIRLSVKHIYKEQIEGVQERDDSCLNQSSYGLSGKRLGACCRLCKALL